MGPFERSTIPQGLKPNDFREVNVRAEARTLQIETRHVPGLKPRPTSPCPSN
jgi:hypothetical protein